MRLKGLRRCLFALLLLLLLPACSTTPCPAPHRRLHRHHAARSLPYFTTHHELVRLQREALDAKRKQRVGLAKDDEWSGDGFVQEAASMVSNS